MPRIKNTAAATTAKTKVATPTTKDVAKKAIIPTPTEGEWMPKRGEVVLRNYKGKTQKWVFLDMIDKTRCEGYWQLGDTEEDAEICNFCDLEQHIVYTPKKVMGMITRYAHLTLTGKLRAFMLTGQTGVGKSEGVEEALESLGFEFDTDYKVVKGMMSPVGLFKFLYDNNGLPIIFDDVNPLIQNPTAVSILMACLDSGKRRIVTWASDYKGLVDEGYPKSFEVTSPIIFISNLDPKKLPAPFVGRTAGIAVKFTVDEVLELMEWRQPEMCRRHNMSMKDADKIRLLMGRIKHQIPNMSLRTFSLAMDVYSATGDMEMLRHQLTTNVSYE